MPRTLISTNEKREKSTPFDSTTSRETTSTQAIDIVTNGGKMCVALAHYKPMHAPGYDFKQSLKWIGPACQFIH